MTKKIMRKSRIVVIGGGTGTSIVLAALRMLGVEPTAIVPTSDSGGSSGILTKELGIIPVGDIRQCVLSLGNFSESERALWNSRFTKGSLDGHALGNLILARLLLTAPSVDEALERVRTLWDLKGRIIPMTNAPTTLCARYRDGTRVCDEHAIDAAGAMRGGIADVFLQKSAALNPRAASAIRRAELLIIAHGDIYTSIFPTMVTHGFSAAIAASSAKILLVANLMTKRGSTDGFTLSQLVAEVDTRLAPRAVDMVLGNSSAIPKRLLARYSRLGSRPIAADLPSPFLKTKRIMRASLVDTREAPTRVPGDRLTRSTIRHDPAKLARAFKPILKHYS